jgi:tetratricopeptide (TPR) repeat protein
MSEQSSANTKIALAIVGGLLVGFVVGFVLANSINKQEDEKLRGELARARAGGAQKDSGGGNNAPSRTQGQSGAQSASGNGGGPLPTLSDEQLKSAVAKADASPSDADTQKKAGQLLYYYALQTGDASLLPDAARILKRAHELDAKDYDTAVKAGNAYFIMARNGGDDPAPLADARKLYEAALGLNPDDVIVRTSLGLTYFYSKPPDARRAIREYRQALKTEMTEPQHEMVLQSLALALIETGDLKEAETRLGELEKLNPSNPELPTLRTQLEQKKNAAADAR